jgi:nucleotide-binding universal stress UspA family protein
MIIKDLLMKNRFLVLIDFSTYSKDQLFLAHTWSVRIKAELLLIHVPLIRAPALTDRETEKEIVTYEKEKALAQLQAFADEVLGEHKNINFLASEKNLLLLIPQLLNEGFNDLIIVGLKGTGVLKKIFWGSTTIDIVNNINHPVVAVPKNLSNFTPDSFYVGIYPKFPLNTTKFDYILHFFGSLINNIFFFSVITNQNDHQDATHYLESLVEKYKPLKNSTYKIFEGEDAFKEIKNFMLNHTDGMLLVQRGSRSFLDQISRKFLINELVYDASTPLLILPV